MRSLRRTLPVILLLALGLAACQPAPPVQVFGTQPAQPTVAFSADEPVVLPPTQTPTPTARPPTATPQPGGLLRQLTSGGCCVAPFWSPDSSAVWFIDRPPNSPTGIWSVGVAPGSSPQPQLVTEHIGIYSPDGALVAFPIDEVTYITRLATGDRWAIDNGGRRVVFSPDSQQIAWQSGEAGIWVADVSGENARGVVGVVGGRLLGWFPDGEHLLVSGYDGRREYAARVSIESGAVMPFVEAPDLSGVLLDPGGEWVAYMVIFSGDPDQDGLWVASIDGKVNERIDLFGAYRWRAAGRLVVVPQTTIAGSHWLAEVNANNAIQPYPLTDPSRLPFRIAGGDWAVAPDGSMVVFVNAIDRNLWVIELPPIIN